jgi:hypothetical protein
MRIGYIPILLAVITVAQLTEVASQRIESETRIWERFASNEENLYNYDSNIAKTGGRVFVWVQALEREWHAVHSVAKYEVDCRLKKSRSLAGVDYQLLRHQDGPPFGTREQVEEWNRQFPNSPLPMPAPIVVKTGPPERTWDTPNAKFTTIVPGTVMEALADTVCTSRPKVTPTTQTPKSKRLPIILQ